MIEVAAVVACVILAALAIFQILLIAGLPLGRFAWGGSHKILPAKLRIGSAVSIVLYGLFAGIILERSGLVSLIENDAITNIGIWVLTAYLLVGTFMNFISRSKQERLVMTPVAAVLFVLCLLVALG